MSDLSRIASAYQTMNEYTACRPPRPVHEDEEGDDQVYFVDVVQRFRDIEETAMSICHDIKELVEEPSDKTSAEDGDYSRHPLYAAAAAIIGQCHDAQDEIDRIIGQ